MLTMGVIPGLSRLGNELWAIYALMRRAFKEGFRHVIIETDNYEAYQIVKNFSNGAPTALYHLVNQIDILINNSTWVCTLAFIYAARNRVGRYAARLGMEVGDHLYTLEHPVAGVNDLLAWDMGMGVDHPDFQDIVIPENAPSLSTSMWT